MLPFRISVQLNVELLIALSTCNSQHARAITTVLLLNYRAYPDCLNRSVYSKCALCNKTWIKYSESILFVLTVVYPGGTHDIFARGVCHFMVSMSTLSGILDEKVGPFSKVLCLMEVPKYNFESCFGKKWLPFSKHFPKIVDF